MAYQIDLPMLDHDGTLSPIVLDAMSAGATSANHPTDPDKFVLTLPTKAALKAFEAAIKVPDTTADLPDDPTPEAPAQDAPQA